MEGPKQQKALVVVLLLYAALIAINLLAEHPNDVTQFVYHLFKKDCSGREETTIQVNAFPYNLISLLYPPPGELKVRIVTFQPGSEPRNIFGDGNVCRQRLFLARLIHRLEQLGAKSIVIDKSFNAHTCERFPKGEQNGTDELRSVVSTTSIPITLGLHTTNVRGPAGTSRDIKTCLVLEDALQFGSGKCAGKAKCVEEGSIRLNRSTRKIPITWEIFASDREAQLNTDPRLFRSLSVVAALQSDPEGKARERLFDLLKHPDPSHPYTFLSEIPRLPARQVLCGVDFPEDAGPNWDQICKSPNIESVPESIQPTGRRTNEEIAREIKGHTIVVGEVADYDNHDSVIGVVPGFLLQANYIQSLLDARYFLAIPGVVSFCCYLLWFAFTYVMFSKKKETPGIAAMWSALGLVGLIVLSLVVMKYLGRIFPWELEIIISLFALIAVHWVIARGHRAATGAVPGAGAIPKEKKP